MKKHFNIKKISLIVFTFICIFFTMKNVAAKDEYVCFYVEPHLDTKSYTYKDGSFYTTSDSKLYVKMTYENGNVSFTYYDSKTKTTHSSLSSDTYGEQTISSKSGNQLTSNDFANGCPTELDRMSWYPGTNGYIYDIFKSGTEEYKQFRETKLKDSTWKKNGGDGSLQNNKSYCYSDEIANLSLSPNEYPRVICDKVVIEVLSETQEPEVNNGNIISCSYVNEDILIQDGTQNKNLTPHITIKINKKAKTITGTNLLSTNTSSITSHFTTDDIENSCPNVIYTDNTSSSTTELYLNKADVPSDNAAKFSNIKYLTKTDLENGKTGCASLGGLVKYLKMAYILLRYLVPTIIIIFSVIDFLGVILSGENEKMEKAKKRFITRLIVGFLVLIIPSILELLLKLVGIIETNQNLVDVACQIF